jgi:hypothetical protein
MELPEEPTISEISKELLENIIAIFSWYWVVALASEWVATNQTLQPNPGTLDNPVFFHCFSGIVRTGGTIAAGRGKIWRYGILVQRYS